MFLSFRYSFMILGNSEFCISLHTMYVFYYLFAASYQSSYYWKSIHLTHVTIYTYTLEFCWKYLCVLIKGSNEEFEDVPKGCKENRTPLLKGKLGVVNVFVAKIFVTDLYSFIYFTPSTHPTFGSLVRCLEWLVSLEFGSKLFNI